MAVYVLAGILVLIVGYRTIDLLPNRGYYVEICGAITGAVVGSLFVLATNQ